MPVVAILLVISMSCLCQSIDLRPLKYIFISVYIISCFINPLFLYFLPLCIYDISRDRLHPLLIPVAVLLLYTLSEGGNLRPVLYCIIFSFVSVIMEMLDLRIKRLTHELIVTRDNAVEYNNTLKNKNRQILEAQDTEIRLATLRERNRIAREIHDNVGHMLTRSILQMGALRIINKDENLSDSLDSVKNTLDEAMNSIRKSVHDLHDDSVDLESAIKEAAEPLKERFTVNIEYDISGHVRAKIKYCFIAIVKEAVNNILKHSSGNAADIILREHPGMFTLQISDNGNCPEPIKDGGIGLENMRERVQALDGNISINSSQAGFKIFVSVMKER